MRYTIKTKGMMCGHCEAHVEEALLAIAGVTDAEADHESNTVQVDCDASVAPEQLSAAVAGAGDYEALSVEAA